MLEKLLEKVEGTVFLTIDAHKLGGHSVTDYLKLYNHTFTEGIDDDMLKRMRSTDKIFELQFNSVSPSQKCIFWGATLEEVMKNAMDHLSENENKKL